MEQFKDRIFEIPSGEAGRHKNHVLSVRRGNRRLGDTLNRFPIQFQVNIVSWIISGDNIVQDANSGLLDKKVSENTKDKAAQPFVTKKARLLPHKPGNSKESAY